MKTATVTDLRNNFRRVSSWIEQGETVHILKHGHAFACLTAERVFRKSLDVPKIDFMAQLREVWGERVFSKNEVQAMRVAELGGEEG